ncbi:MAG: pitrilysin family protein [Alphaproteobacteria bacterium]|nr:pitrilysin family protein [Alphaproteobacteria bacterium]
MRAGWWRQTRIDVATALAAGVAALFPSAQAQTSEAWRPETFKLANGITAVVLPDHRAPVVTHMIWYRVGSADEVPGKSGIAHFFEHLMFKATGKIAAGEYSKIVARNGGQDNASTSYDYTNYFFRVAKDRLPQMMELEADRMTGLQLAESEVVSERDVVKEERRQNVDSAPSSLLNEKVYAALYSGHPYSIPVIGRMSEVGALTRDDALGWYSRWYGPEDAILVVAGDITAAELKPLADRIYGSIAAKGDLQKRSWPEVRPLAETVRVSHSDPKVRQPEWSRYWLGVETGDPQAEALQVGLEILGGGRTSRLNRELVETQGVAVSAYAFTSDSVARGIIGVGGSPSPGKTLDAVEKAAAAVVDQFLGEGPTATELVRAKARIAASETFARDSQVSMANWYGGQLVAGQTIEQIQAWDDRVRAVTAEQVKQAMNAYMTGVHHVDATLLVEPQ